MSLCSAQSVLRMMWLRRFRRGTPHFSSALLLVLAVVVFLPCAAPAASYVVRKSDTLTRIARKNDVSVKELARVNGLDLDDIIRPGQRLTLPDSKAAKKSHAPERTVVVRKNDTLTLIARVNGVEVQDLANANGLSLKSTIYPGQRLVIPSGPVAAPRPKLPAKVQRAIDRAPVRKGRWKYIVVHHSATSSGTPKGMDNYHRRVRHMENGLAYHFVIGNGHGMKDGEIFVGNRWIKQLQGGHLHSESLNEISLGICLVGDFDKTVPTRRQLDSLESLLSALMKRCHLGTSAIKTHQQINPVYTRCPGKRFDLKAVIRRLES